MINCPNCNHQNPDGALQCEACYTPLPVLITCPSCNSPVQANASFCGQCGNDLRGETATTIGAEGSGVVGNVERSNEVSGDAVKRADLDVPELIIPDPLVEPDPISSPENSEIPEIPEIPETPETPETPEILESQSAEPSPDLPPSAPHATRLQVLSARFRQVQTGTLIEIPRQLSVIRIGKPNDQTSPDIDVSGFPDSEVVSRVHANLRVEGDIYYLEDVGSSNGTYINGLPLPVGNRHRLRSGDRIALGKGDKVSFIFETA